MEEVKKVAYRKPIPGGLKACFIVRDQNGQALAYVYFKQEPAGAAPPDCSCKTKRATDSSQHREAGGAP